MRVKDQINLLQPDLSIGRNGPLASVQKFLLPVFLSVVVVLFGGLYLQESRKKILLKNEVESIMIQRDQLRAQIAALGASLGGEETPEINPPSSLKDLNVEKKIVWSRILLEVSLVVPEGVWMTRFESDAGDGVRFEGFAASYKNLTDLISSLEGSAYFQDVFLEYSRQRPAETKIDFSVFTHFKKPAFESSKEKG